jgi:DNA-binding transcriptional LysR family regulator
MTSFFGGMVAEAFRAGGHEPPHVTVSSQSFSVQNELLATGRFLTVLPGFMLRVSDRRPPLKALRVKLPNTPRPIAIITLKNRTLTPLAQLFIANVRALAKSLAHS